MNNKVRITYTVSLADVPKETQALVDKLSKEAAEVGSILSGLDFTADFQLSHEKLKNVSLILDKAQTIALDTLSLSEGYREIQNRATSPEQEVEHAVEDPNSLKEEPGLND